MLDPHGIYPVVLNGKIGDYIRDDRPALHAFFAVLNRAFADFRLNLKPSLLANYNFMDTGKTSISVGYQNGTDRNTLEKHLVTLNVKY